MRRVSIVGIGAGDPAHLTLQAVAAIGAASVFFVVAKEGAADELVDLRREILARHAAPGHRVVEIADPPRERDPVDYRATVQAWRARRAERWERVLRDELSDGERGAFLVWGDPALYDSTIDVVDAILGRGRVPFEHEVIPGISSPQALAAAHRIALNRVGGAVELTPARRLAHGFASDSEDVVVLLDAGSGLDGIDDGDVDVYWGAYLATADELLVAGPLARKRAEIERVRAEARRRKGWIFDTYLLRRRRDP